MIQRQMLGLGDLGSAPCMDLQPWISAAEYAKCEADFAKQQPTVDIPATSDIVSYCANRLGYNSWWWNLQWAMLGFPDDMNACMAKGGQASQFGVPMGTTPPPYDPSQFKPGMPVGYDPNTGTVTGNPGAVITLPTPQQYGQWSSQNTPTPQPSWLDTIYANLPSGKTMLLIAGAVVVGVMFMRSR